MIKSFITVRTQFEGFHHYPNASDIDPRIKFLETTHRHIFKVNAKIQVFGLDRELEFFLVKWYLNEFITETDMDNKSCEMIALDILNHLQAKYGVDRQYEIIVSEDGESDGIIEYLP